MDTNTNFNLSHPELKTGEVFLANLTRKEYLNLGFTIKRLGNFAYGRYGERCDGRLQVRPVFINKEEFRQSVKNEGKSLRRRARSKISATKKTSKKSSEPRSKGYDWSNTPEIYIPYSATRDDHLYTNCTRPEARVGFLDLVTAKRYAKIYDLDEIQTVKIFDKKDFERMHEEETRQRALAKLTPEEKKVLGLN